MKPKHRMLVTGMNGTVAPALATELRCEGHEVLAWDREKHPPMDEAAVRGLIEATGVTGVCHIATGDPAWAEWIARVCAERGLPLLWTGSVSVFSEAAQAPLRPEMQPDATDDYGRYKFECERRVLEADPRAIVARIGWQIGSAPGSNTMTNYLFRTAEEGGGRLVVSRRWIPSCTFLEDTAAALVRLLSAGEPGVFHVEGNSAGLSLFDIAAGLNRTLRFGWDVLPIDEPVRDNRMQDERVRVNGIEQRLRRV